MGNAGLSSMSRHALPGDFVRPPQNAHNLRPFCGGRTKSRSILLGQPLIFFRTPFCDPGEPTQFSDRARLLRVRPARDRLRASTVIVARLVFGWCPRTVALSCFHGITLWHESRLACGIRTRGMVVGHHPKTNRATITVARATQTGCAPTPAAARRVRAGQSNHSGQQWMRMSA